MDNRSFDVVRSFIIPVIATICVLIFAIHYQPEMPLWWPFALTALGFGYGYFYVKNKYFLHK